MKLASHGRSRISRTVVGLVGAGALVAAAGTPMAGAHRSLAGPSQGGTISVALTGAPDCLDPQRTAASASDAVFESVADGLVSLDDQSKIAPNLATSWDVSPDGKTITFHLRHNVKFSNGDPFTASDVKFTYDRAVNPATKSPNSASLLAAVKATTVVDPYTVRLTLAKPNRFQLNDLDNGYTGILDAKALQAEGPDKFCQFPVGTGPYMVQSVGPGFSTVTTVRNPYRNWEPPWAHNQGKPYLDKIIYKSILQPTTQISELLAGSLDLIPGIDATQLSRVQHNAKISLYSGLTPGEDVLEFNTTHFPFNTMQGRVAAAEAINRDAIVSAVLNGQGQAAYSPVPPGMQFYDPASKTYAPQYNPTDAASKWSATHATGLYTLLSFNDPQSTTGAELIQAELQAAGIRTRITPRTVADFISAAGKGQYDMLILGWGWPDASIMYQLYHSSQEVAGGLNFTFYKSPIIDNSITTALSSFDDQKAAAAFNTFQQYMDKNVIVDPLIDPTGIYAASSRLKGWHTGGSIGALFRYEDMYLQ